MPPAIAVGGVALAANAKGGVTMNLLRRAWHYIVDRPLA
jgi:hypothetical protein